MTFDIIGIVKHFQNFLREKSFIGKINTQVHIKTVLQKAVYLWYKYQKGIHY